MASKPGRNDPCSCGSGKKYKRCCGARPSSTRSPLRDSFQRRAEAPVLDPDERDGMRAAGRFNAELMDFIRPRIQPGVSTEEIDRQIHEYTLDHGHTPACLGYKGFSRSCCISPASTETALPGTPGESRSTLNESRMSVGFALLLESESL